MNTTHYGATCATIDGDFVITSVFPVEADWGGCAFVGYCRPTRAEIKQAGYETDCVSVFALAVEQEKHPAVRHVLGLNAWKSKTWREYASWKKHATRWVAIAWQGELGRIAAMKGFEEQ
jgi:hypothetical protein